MHCMNTMMMRGRQDDEDSAERRAFAAEARAIELMQPGEDCDPCSHDNLAEALCECSGKDGQMLGQLLREGKFAEAGIFLRGISHAYWAIKADEQAQEQTA